MLVFERMAFTGHSCPGPWAQQLGGVTHAKQGFEGELRHWDVGFWAERLREAKYAITDEQLRPYFALPTVLDGLFKVRLPVCVDVRSLAHSA